MKIVVIGGTGLIGSKTVERLRKKGHEVLAASPNSGVNTYTGEGLTEALRGAEVVIDLANSPVFQGEAVREFFETAGRNLLAAEIAAGVRHHVALSVVGVDRLEDSDYFRGKIAQEELIQGGNVPYTIVRSTQFFEFMGAIAQSNTDGDMIRLSPAYMQPIASDEVADAVTDAALSGPVNGVIEIAGPQRLRITEIVQALLSAKNDARKVVPDINARYFGAKLNEQSLVPAEHARIAQTSFKKWLSDSAVPA